jgi:hypothetical protein
MKYAVQMDSDATIYIPSFIKIGSGMQNLLKGEFTNTQAGKRSQNYWGFGLCPSSCILKTREHTVSETGSVSVLR